MGAGWSPWSPTDTATFPTAMAALAAVRARDTAAVDAGTGTDVTVTRLEWTPRTAVGRAVVNAVTGTKGAK